MARVAGCRTVCCNDTVLILLFSTGLVGAFTRRISVMEGEDIVVVLVLDPFLEVAEVVDVVVEIVETVEGL